MKLLILSASNPTGTMPAWGNLFPNDMHWGFEQLGWQSKIFIAKNVEDLKICLTTYKPDLIFTLGSPSLYKEKNVLKYIGSRTNSCGYKYVHWDTDSIIWKNIELPFIELTKPDITFTICSQMMALLQSQGIYVKRLDYGFNSTLHYPQKQNAQYKDMIALVARYYKTNDIAEHTRGKSIRVLADPLLNSGYNIDLWGSKPFVNYTNPITSNKLIDQYKHHGELSYNTTREVYSSCAVNLVLQNTPYFITKRTYEIMASGGFAISYDIPEIRKVFVPDKEIVLSSNAKETIDKFNYYISHPREKQRIIKNGLIALQKHNYKARAEAVVHEIMILSN